MAKRKSISKKVRFEVFKRDIFSCQYCGRTPPAVVLEIDHVQPVSKNGQNDIDNLVTACFDCNRGKSNNLLNVLPSTVKEKAALLEEKEVQLREYKKLIRSVKARKTREVNKVSAIFTGYFEDVVLTETAEDSIRHKFLPLLVVNDVEAAMHMACIKCSTPMIAFKYFCGICWKCIKTGESP